MLKRLKHKTKCIWILLFLNFTESQFTQGNQTIVENSLDHEDSNEIENSPELPPESPEANEFSANETSVETQSFIELLQKDEFVTNETLHIKEMLKNENTDVLLICCPRRYGKGIDLNMLQTFLQFELSADKKTIIPYRDSTAYKLFIKGEHQNGTKLTDKVLEISKEKEIVNKYLAQWPVINFSMKTVFLRKSTNLYENLAQTVRNLYKKYDYLKTVLQHMIENPSKNTTITKSRAQWFIQVIEKYQSKNCPTKEYIQGVKTLSEILYQCFQKKVFILVERYDKPFHEIYLQRRDKAEKKELMEYLRFFLKATFKNNAFMKKGVMISIFPLPRKDILGGMPKADQYFLLGKLGYFRIFVKDIEKLIWKKKRKKTTTKSSTTGKNFKTT